MRTIVTDSRSPALEHYAAVLLLAASVVFTVSSALATPVFAPAVPYPTGGTPGYPYAVSVGDLNGDGKPDLVSANSFVNTVSVRLGNGDGTFGAKSDFLAGSTPLQLAIADLNGDTKADLAVVREQIVSVLLGNGDGTFAAPADLAVGTYPSSIAAIDVSGDGKLDLVVAHDYPGAIAVLLGHGDGTFEPYVDHAGSSPYRLAVGDLNADGRPDVVSADLIANSMSVFLGGGGGAYAYTSSYRAGGSPNSDVVADLNGDGKLDVVVANEFTNDISVLMGNADGSFGPAGCFPLDGDCGSRYPAGNGPSWVAAGDLDVDGKADLAVTDRGSDSVLVLRGVGDGTFSAAGRYKVGIFPENVVIRDLNGDGRPDLVTADYYSNQLSVLMNQTTVSVQEPRSPARFELSSAGANPFRAGTWFEIGIPHSAHIRLDVYDALGRRIRTLEDGVLAPGRHARYWDGAASDGSPAAAGLYFIRLSAPETGSVLRAVLAR